MKYSVIITTLIDSSQLIIVEALKLGYELSLWSDNDPFSKGLNGPGGIVTFSLEPKSKKEEIKSLDLVYKIRTILKDKDIPYFSIAVFHPDYGSSAVSGNLKPAKQIIPKLKNKPSYLKRIK